MKEKLIKCYRLDPEFFLFIGISALLVYSVSWGNDFISDDVWGIRDSTYIGDFWEQSKTLDIKAISFSAIYNIFGPTPLWFHIHNTIIHVVSVFLVYAVVIGLSENKFIARITTVLFALHPIEAEAVTWISGAPYAILTMLLLASFLLFMLVEKKKLPPKMLAASAFFYATAIAMSVFAIVTPAIFILYLLYFSRISRDKLKLLIPTIGISILFLAYLYVQFTGRVADVNPEYAGGTHFYNPLQQIPIAIGTYVQLFLFPYNLTLYHEFNLYQQWMYSANVITTVLVLGIAMLFWRVNKFVSFGIISFIVSLTPTFLPIRVAWIVAERYAHFGSVFFFLSISTLLYMLVKKLKISSDHVLMGSVIFVLILASLTVKRNLEWRSEDTLWPVTVKHSPTSAYAHNNMGDYYGRHGDLQNAILSFERARQLRPRYGEATHNLANIYAVSGQATKAAELYRESVEFNPNLFQSYQKLATISFLMGNYKEAEIYILESIQINPDPFGDYISLAKIYATAGNREGALEALSQAQSRANSPEKMQLLADLVRQLNTP